MKRPNGEKNKTQNPIKIISAYLFFESLISENIAVVKIDNILIIFGKVHLTTSHEGPEGK